ncbi:hypothetical protein [Pantoea agglomerans]|uniref:hypothetical protein n=1 Tax=Enterobacter agglomerans TaxID=549 RepID=UPI001303BC84|nr:hypothetical protein [Pantoea agglomerans]
MNYFIMVLVMLTSVQAAADVTHDKTYPSCDVQAQRSVKGETGDRVTDPLEAYIFLRVNILQADISTARKARRLRLTLLWRRAVKVRSDAAQFVKQQGFLSAAERASYERELDKLAGKLCNRIKNISETTQLPPA